MTSRASLAARRRAEAVRIPGIGKELACAGKIEGRGRWVLVDETFQDRLVQHVIGAEVVIVRIDRAGLRRKANLEFLGTGGADHRKGCAGRERKLPE